MAALHSGKNRFLIPTLYALGVLLLFGEKLLVLYRVRNDEAGIIELLPTLFILLLVQFGVIWGLILRKRSFQWLALCTVAISFCLTVLSFVAGYVTLRNSFSVLFEVALLALLSRELRNR